MVLNKNTSVCINLKVNNLKKYKEKVLVDYRDKRAEDLTLADWLLLTKNGY